MTRAEAATTVVIAACSLLLVGGCASQSASFSQTGSYKGRVQPLPVNVTPPKLLRGVQPTYPVSPDSQGIQGCAWIGFDISVRGRPVNLRVLASRPIQAFGAAAVKTMSRWRFEPAMRDGKPIEVTGYAQRFFYRLYPAPGVRPMPDCSDPRLHGKTSLPSQQ